MSKPDSAPAARQLPSSFVPSSCHVGAPMVTGRLAAEKPDKIMLGHNRKMIGAECLADMLAGYGVTHVFTVPAVLRRTFVEMERRNTKIARVHCHGEKSAAYMADGNARASGKPGICMAQVIGALNLAAGLRDAHLAHSPVLAFTGGRDPKTKFRKVYQEIDDVPAFEPVTKMNATIDDVTRIPDMVRQAFRVATSGAPGPVHLQFHGKDCIPGTHALSVGVVGSYSRETANRAVNAADLVCFIGTETGGMTTHFWAVPKIGTPAIQIDIEPESLGRNYPLQASVLGDIKAVLVRMLGQIDKSSVTKRAPWIKEISALRAEWYAKYKPLLESDSAPINPARICHEFTQHVPDNGIVVVDTGHAGMWMGGMYDTRLPSQNYIRSAGHLGWAFPAGIGAQAACPERPVVVFTGDAGFWYHIAEIETAVRWKINSVTVVNNNGGGNQSKRGFDRAYGGTQTEQGRELWTYNPMNFAKLAEDMGALGIRVERAGDIAPARSTRMPNAPIS